MVVIVVAEIAIIAAMSMLVGNLSTCIRRFASNDADGYF
jgi:hypothetical protein